MSREEAMEIVGMLKCWVPLDDKDAVEARTRLIKAATEKLLKDDGR